MKILWLGQGGLLFVTGNKKIMIDPYLTNSLCKINHSLNRKMKVNKKLFDVKPDVLVLTNSHPDHTDMETIIKLAKKQKNKLTILCCGSIFSLITSNSNCSNCNTVMFEYGCEWSIEGAIIEAVYAKSDDATAFGVIITDTTDGKKYYVAEDTLYSKYVLEDIPSDVYAAFIPINGEYGSMNVLDAKRFAEKINARHTVPIHFGMFDDVNPEEFQVENKIIPQIYHIIDFGNDDDLAKNESSSEENEGAASNEPIPVVVTEPLVNQENKPTYPEENQGAPVLVGAENAEPVQEDTKKSDDNKNVEEATDTEACEDVDDIEENDIIGEAEAFKEVEPSEKAEIVEPLKEYSDFDEADDTSKIEASIEKELIEEELDALEREFGDPFDDEEEFSSDEEIEEDEAFVEDEAFEDEFSSDEEIEDDEAFVEAEAIEDEFSSDEETEDDEVFVEAEAIEDGFSSDEEIEEDEAFVEDEAFEDEFSSNEETEDDEVFVEDEAIEEEFSSDEEIKDDEAFVEDEAIEDEFSSDEEIEEDDEAFVEDEAIEDGFSSDEEIEDDEAFAESESTEDNPFTEADSIEEELEEIESELGLTKDFLILKNEELNEELDEFDSELEELEYELDSDENLENHEFEPFESLDDLISSIDIEINGEDASEDVYEFYEAEEAEESEEFEEAEESEEFEEIEDETPSSYVRKEATEDDASLIDKYILDLERFERGESDGFSND